MEYFFRAFLLLALASVCAENLEVKILDSTRRIEKPGMSMELSCHLNQGLPVILTHTIEWVHVSLANGSEPKETVLTTQQTLTDKASPNEYDINVDYNNTRCLFKLVVKRVRAQNDGIFKCRVTENDNGQKIEKEAHVIVVNDVEKISLRFDGGESIEREEKVGMQREEGRYGVTCMAFGFNPDATIKLFLGDQEQETGGTQITLGSKASVAAGARRYSARATATQVHLKAEHSGRRLKCQAQAGFDGAATLVASVPLSVIVPNMDASRQRTINFTEEEIRCLLELIKERGNALFCKLNNAVTVKKKQALWDDITHHVNARGKTHRPTQKVKKKWSDLRLSAIRLRSKVKKPTYRWWFSSRDPVVARCRVGHSGRRDMSS